MVKSAEDIVQAFVINSQTVQKIMEPSMIAVGEYRKSLALKFVKEHGENYSGFWYKSYRFQPEKGQIPLTASPGGRMIAKPLYAGETEYSDEAENIVKEYEELVANQSYIAQTMNMLTAGLETAQDVRNAWPDVFANQTELSHLSRTAPETPLGEPVKEDMLAQSIKLIHFYLAAKLIM